MTSDYRIIGSQESPYSGKVRAYLRYKGIPHTWHTGADARERLQQHGKRPLIPLVITPQGQGLQNSTTIIQSLESKHPEPAIYPTDPVANFMAALLEEFSDEWGNKWVVHYRWAREADQTAYAKRLAGLMDPSAGRATRDAHSIHERLMDPVWFAASTAQMAHQIEASFKDTLALLEPHLARHPYLFGGRPSLADFGLWGQLHNTHRDPTPRGIMEIQAPNTLAWLERMQSPSAAGDFEPWDVLAATLAPLVSDQVAGLFLPWSAANARAVASAAATFTVLLRGESWEQQPQRYPAQSLAALQQAYRNAQHTQALNDALEATTCLSWLRA